MFYALMICSDEACAEERETYGSLEELEALACDCGCALQVLELSDVEFVDLRPAPAPRLWSPREEYPSAVGVPVSPGAPTATWTRTPPCWGTTSGASMTSPSRTGQPASSPARTASSTSPVPATSTTPPMAWSASQGCVRSDRREVNTSPSECGSRMTAPSSGWSAAACPSEVASVALPVGCSQ